MPAHHPHDKHTPGEPLDYDYIDDGIYLGTNQCCDIGLSEVLKKEGIVADMSLEDVRIDNPYGVEVYAWIPVVDTEPPSPDQLDYGVGALKKLVQQGKKVYVHCKNGHGRSTTMVAAYFIDKGIESVQEVLDFIKTKRPTIHLSEAQMKALETFSHK